MSNLDTTLREKFYSKIAEFSGPEKSAIDPYPMQRIADFFLSELHQVMNEKREAIKVDSSSLCSKHRDYCDECNICRKTAQVNLHDVLSILKD